MLINVDEIIDLIESSKCNIDSELLIFCYESAFENAIENENEVDSSMFMNCLIAHCTLNDENNE